MQMPERLTAEVDYSVCKGHGRCYMSAVDLFDCDDDGYPVVIGAATTPTEIAALERAIANCPERAISAVAVTPS